MREPGLLDERILVVVDAVPVGRLVSYGDLAVIMQMLGMPCTARRVARTMREFGAGVPWWRVVRSDGTLAPAVAQPAAERLRGEGVAVDGARVPLVQLRWQPDLDALSQLMR